MAIKTQRVALGGLGGGVVLTLVDFVANGIILADQNMAALAALNPSLAANMEGGGAIAGYIFLDFLFAFLIVWTYAALRPRFGAGPKTAAIAAIQVWLVSGLMYAFMAMTGMFTWGYFAIGGVVALVVFLAGGLAGAFLYKEE